MRSLCTVFFFLFFIMCSCIHVNVVIVTCALHYVKLVYNTGHESCSRSSFGLVAVLLATFILYLEVHI